MVEKGPLSSSCFACLTPHTKCALGCFPLVHAWRGGGGKGCMACGRGGGEGWVVGRPATAPTDSPGEHSHRQRRNTKKEGGEESLCHPPPTTTQHTHTASSLTHPTHFYPQPTETAAAMPHSFGYRARTRSMFRRAFGEAGVNPLSIYMRNYKVRFLFGWCREEDEEDG